MTPSRRDGPVERLLEVVRMLVDLDRRRLTRAVPPGAHVFEIGAGSGRLLAMLAASGRVVAGIEPIAVRAARARARGVAVDTAAIDETALAEASQDAVILWHVLEHLDEPAAALERVHRWLVPGGVLIVATPNLSSLQARIGGDRWFHQNVPRHVLHFTPAGLRALLGRTGFRIDDVRHVLLEQNLLGMWQTLQNFVTVERDVFFRLTKEGLSPGRFGARDLAAVTVAAPLLLPLAAALELAAGLARRGGSVVVTARSAPR